MASIRKRGAHYSVTAYLGYSAQGKQRKKSVTYTPPPHTPPAKAEKLARAYAQQWEAQLKTTGGGCALTLAQLCAWYYQTVAPQTLKPQVLEAYRAAVQSHVLPALGQMRAGDITPAMLDELFAQLYAGGNLQQRYRLKNPALCRGQPRAALAQKAGLPTSTLYALLGGGCVTPATAQRLAAALRQPVNAVFENATVQKGLSGASVNKIKLNLSAVFSAAVKKELLPRNPCLLATVPRASPRPAAYLTQAQCRRLLSSLRGQADFQLEVMVTLLLATGLRSGEVCALHWDDIDLPQAMLTVRATLAKVHGVYTRQPPKTRASCRCIILPPAVVALLRQLKARQAAAGAAHPSVFANRAGGYLLGQNLNAAVKKACAAAGLEGVHTHSLRHTHASLLINADIAAKTVADRLGHASTQTTLDIYSHVFARSRARAAQAVNSALFL